MITNGRGIRSWIIFGILWLMLLAFTVVSFYGRAGGNLGDKEYNQKVVQNYINRLPGLTKKDSSWDRDALRKPSKFLVVKKIGNDYVLKYQSDRSFNKERWKSEDIDDFDYIVLTTISTSAANYQNTGTKEVVTMTSTNGYLDYYDLAERRIVYSDSVGGSLPYQTTTVKNYSVGDDSILSQACERLGGLYFHDIMHYILLVATVGVGIGTALLFINERKKRIAAKKAETAGEEPEEPRPAGPVFRS